MQKKFSHDSFCLLYALTACKYKEDLWEIHWRGCVWMLLSLKNITTLCCFCPTRQAFVCKSSSKHANEVPKTEKSPWRIPCFSRIAVSYEHPGGCTEVSKEAFIFIEYSPLLSLLSIKLTFKSFQLQVKAERLEELT